MSSRIGLFVCAGAILGLAVGCGKVKSTEDGGGGPADAAPPSSDGGGDVCTGNLTECDSTCVNTDTDHEHCGSCTKACDSAQVCSGGECTTTCDGTLTACSGSCVDTTSDRDHCGSCANACAVDQACVDSGCAQLSDVAVPQFTKTPPKKTGWTTYPSDVPMEFTFPDVGLSEATYECRTGPASIIGSLSFVRCDGAGGTTPIHQPVPNATTPEGSYRTEMRIRVNTWTSGTIGYDYYVHHSLDNVQLCTVPDPATVFAAATLTKTGAFDASVLEIEKPFVSIKFENVIVNPSMTGGGGWSSAQNGNPFTVQFLSLRRRFTLSPDGQYLLVQRTFEGRTARIKGGRHSCSNMFKFGANNGASTGTPQKQFVDCQNMVLNRRGQAQCVRPGTTPRLSSDLGWVKLQRKGPENPFSGKSRNPACTSPWFSEVCIFLPD